MVQRSVVVPTDPERLWHNLTDPAALAGWFGAEVEWAMVPGSPARFSGGEDGDRSGRVEDLVPARRLRFRWWPEADQGAASEVTYILEPETEGTRLTVTEEPVRDQARPGNAEPGRTGPSGPQASAGRAALAWDRWDGRLVALWGAGADACRPAVLAGAGAAARA